MDSLKAWWEDHSIEVMVWVVAWPLMLALWATRGAWSGLAPALKVLQDDAWRKTLEANKDYEAWSAEQLRERFERQREEQAKMKAVTDRIKARHADNMTKLAQYRVQRQAAIDLMKDEASRIRARTQLGQFDRLPAPVAKPSPATPAQANPAQPAANDAPLSPEPQAA